MSRRTTLVPALAAAALLAAAPSAVAKPAPAPTETIHVAAGAACSFAVDLDQTGKIGFLELPGGRILTTAPGLDITATNPLNDASVTVNATGSWHARPLPVTGNLLVTMTGRNVIYHPVLGLKLYVGTFSFVLTPDGLAEVSPVDEDAGHGRIVDLCLELD